MKLKDFASSSKRKSRSRSPKIAPKCDCTRSINEVRLALEKMDRRISNISVGPFVPPSVGPAKESVLHLGGQNPTFFDVKD